MVLRDPSSAKWQLSFIDESNNVFHWRDELVDNNEQESILREQARQLHLMLTAGAQKSRCKCEDQSTSHSAVQSTMNWGRRMQHFQQLRDGERLRRGFNMKTLARKAHKQESRHWDWRPHIKSLVGLGSLPLRFGWLRFSAMVSEKRNFLDEKWELLLAARVRTKA